MRIVTLLPSATEIVCALGFEAELVGRSHECDFPPSVARLPALTEAKFNPEGTSAEIDQRVKKIVAVHDGKSLPAQLDIAKCAVAGDAKLCGIPLQFHAVEIIVAPNEC